MSASIVVAWVDENHNKLEVVHDKDSVIAGLASSRWLGLTASTCLKFVDPWGDTVFNQSQLPVLLGELRSEVEGTVSVSHREHLLRALQLVEKAGGQVHTYIKFIGD